VPDTTKLPKKELCIEDVVLPNAVLKPPQTDITKPKLSKATLAKKNNLISLADRFQQAYGVNKNLLLRLSPLKKNIEL
jgi:hypothetical protein